MKKFYFILSLLVICAFVLGACGTPTTEVVEEPEAAPEEVEEVEADPTACNLPAPDSAVEINLIGWPFAATEFYSDEVEKCEEVENISVNSQQLDFTAVVEQVNLALSTGDPSPYDIIHGTGTEFSTWGPEGWLMPLDDLMSKYSDEYDLADIPEGAFSGATYDGKVYGIPLIGDSQVIAYRSDLLEEAGLSVPTTYDEIIAACEALADVDGLDVPFAIDFSADWAQEIEFLAALRSFGGDYVDDDNMPSFAGPEGVAALEKMVEVKNACMGDAYLSLGYEAAEAGINNGTIAFISIWATSMASMWDPEQSEYSDVIKFAPAAAPMEGGALGGTAWNNYYFIPTETQNDPELIFKIIMEAADLESQKRGAEFGVMSRSSVTEGVPNLPAVNTTIAEGVGAYEINPVIPLVQAALFGELPFAFDGSKTAQEVLEAAAEAYITEATAQGYLSE
jgi:ABC-type glycerol-3-phosphate transport system substrate-binding protein